MKSESIYPLTDTDSTRLPEEMECKTREGAVVSKSSASCENNSIAQAITLKKDHFEEICRCCLSHEAVANIFYLKFDEILLEDIFFKLLGTQVNPNDGLPQNICTACVAALVNFYNFQKIYNNSLATLLSVLGENQVCNIQIIEDDINEDIKEEMSDIHISEDELDVKSQNENINNNDSTESTIFKETQKSESTISDDPKKIFENDELCIATNESLSIPQLEDDPENEQFKIENSDINISEDELDDESQYESNEKENINGVGNNESTKDLAQHKTEKNHLDPLDTTYKICNKVVKNRGLHRHMQNAHNSKKTADVKLDCSTCGKIFANRQYLLQHSKIHGEKNFLCAYCGKRFHTVTKFKKHCLGHTGEKPFLCNECGQKFRTSQSLTRHMYIHTGERKYVCKFCHKAFRQSPHLKRHLRIHTGEKPFKCPYCDKSFTQDTSRVVHIRSHTGEKPYTCDTCGESFRWKDRFTAHRRLHTGEKPYLCDHCGKTFAARTTYRNHVVVKHQHERNSVKYADVLCKICNKFYSTKQTLKTHMLIHGEKTNLCTYCGKGFYTKGGLDAHSVVHIPEKKFSCGLCDKKFARLLSYKTHQYIHSGQKPYICKICSKDFRQSAHLVSHMRTHTGEKPYGCPYCDKTFAHFTTRTVHVRSHTGERPFVCDVCSKGFYHSSTMTKHRRTHFKKVRSEATDGEATD